MSGKEVVKSSAVPGGIREVKVEIVRPRRHTHGPMAISNLDNRGVAKISSRSTDYVYVNSAYVGSVNDIAGSNVQMNRLQQPHCPPTSVIREQYWACSKWPFGQKVLALAVGVLLGALIGLSISFARQGVKAEDVIGGIFRTSQATAE